MPCVTLIWILLMITRLSHNCFYLYNGDQFIWKDFILKRHTVGREDRLVTGSRFDQPFLNRSFCRNDYHASWYPILSISSYNVEYIWLLNSCLISIPSDMQCWALVAFMMWQSVIPAHKSWGTIIKLSWLFSASWRYNWIWNISVTCRHIVENSKFIL